jgi:acyl carrier protein
MALPEQIADILTEVLQIKERSSLIDPNAPLLGAIPEFDSMAVVSILTAIEEKFDFFVDDDEIDAEIFETVSSLVAFVEKKITN